MRDGLDADDMCRRILVSPHLQIRQRIGAEADAQRPAADCGDGTKPDFRKPLLRRGRGTQKMPPGSSPKVQGKPPFSSIYPSSRVPSSSHLPPMLI